MMTSQVYSCRAWYQFGSSAKITKVFRYMDSFTSIYLTKCFLTFPIIKSLKIHYKGLYVIGVKHVRKLELQGWFVL